MKYLISLILCFLLLPLLKGQTAKDKILKSLKSSDNVSVQAKVDQIRKHIIGLESFTDPYYIINKSLETGSEDQCQLALLIEEKSTGTKKRKRNIIYSFNASDIDFPDTWNIKGDILSLPFIKEESVTVEVYRGTKFVKQAKIDVIDLVCPKETYLLLEPLAEIVETCQSK